MKAQHSEPPFASLGKERRKEMMNTKIQAIEYYLPQKILDNNQLEEEFPGWSASKIETKIGIKQRHLAAEDETALDIAVKAAQKVLEHVDKHRIDFVLLCTQSPDYFLPTSACIVQDRLGLRTDIGAFDFNLGCSGYIYGLGIAKALIQSRMATHVLCMTSETYSKHLHPKDRSNRTIFGDGAAATLVTASEQEKIFDFVLGTDGSGYQNLIVPNGGFRHKYSENAVEKEEPEGSFRTDNHLYMNGPEIFNFTIEKVPLVVEMTLQKNKMALEDIDYVIFHQANKYMLNHLRKITKIPKEKFYVNLEHTGNTVSATIPIALKDCLDQGVVKKTDKVLLVGFGVGYSWGATIIEI